MRSGQAIVESLVVLLVVSLLFFGLLEVARAFADREIMRHAAARARTVGFNRWMCEKVARAAAIPASGKMVTPEEEERSPAFERARVPGYLARENSARARAYLHYEGWDDISSSGLGGGSPGLDGDLLKVRLRKRHSLPIFAKAPDNNIELALRGEFDIEAHYPLYIEDRGW